MNPPNHAPITELLVRWSSGDSAAGEEVMPLVYEQLRRIAARQLRLERANHTLQATAIVNEAFLRLVSDNHVEWESRAHFIALCAHTMRRVLVDHARARSRAKRGGGLCKVTLAEAGKLCAGRPPDLIALDDALSDLARKGPELARLVELRFFGGLTIEESAELQGVSVATANRQWRRARAWLYNQLVGQDEPRDRP